MAVTPFSVKTGRQKEVGSGAVSTCSVEEQAGRQVECEQSVDELSEERSVDVVNLLLPVPAVVC